jgi:tetratricopeptide (TPR) repeat protein
MLEMGTRRRRCLGSCVVALGLFAAQPGWSAGAETHERAAALEQAARAEFARENYPRAAELFEQANRLAPFPEFRYNVALSWDKASEQARAADAYETALRLGGLDAERAGASGARLTALKRELAYVRVLRPLKTVVSVAHLKRAPVPVDLHLEPGKHELVFELSGKTVQRTTIDVRAGETSSVEIDLPEPKTRPRPPVAQRAPVREPHTESTSSTRTWGFIALGTGVVLGGVTAYLGVRTLEESERYEDSDLEDLEARDRGLALRTWTNVALAGAIVSAGVGGVLLVLGSGSTEPTSNRGVRIRLTADRVLGGVTF